MEYALFLMINAKLFMTVQNKIKNVKDLKLMFALVIVFITLINATYDPKNPPVSRTGAPGETTCQASGCHNGGAFVGTVDIQGLPSVVEPSKLYTITLTQKSNAKKAGFEMTALGNDLLKAGKFSNVTGTSIGSNVGREYIRQSNAKTFTDTVSWVLNWTAPATLAVSDSITFYFASLCANNDGGPSGDNAVKNSRTVVLKNSTGVVENKKSIEFSIVDKKLVFQSTDISSLELINISGSKIRNSINNDQNILDLSNQATGIYFLKYKLENSNYVNTVKFYLP